MLIFMLCLIFYKLSYVSNKNAGSAIFTSAHIYSKCWTKDNIAKLQARRSFEEIVPTPINPEKVNSQYIKDSLKYFRSALISVQKGVDHSTAEILKEALADAIGGHLKCEILPTIRFAYYAGYIPFRNAREIHDFYDQVKIILNTQGLGWKRPQRIPEWSNLTVAKISIGSGKLLDPCACLVVKRDANNCIHLPPLKLDDKSEPSAIALPFKSEGLINLRSPNSENILLKYYTTVSRCLLHSSPVNCRHADVVNFNNDLWHWMKRDVAPHLVDEKLYAAYGGILRIAAAVQTYGKGLSRRNLFEYKDAGVNKWNPWKSLTESYIYVNTDWTPALYVTVVILAALAICCLQICYNYMFGEANPCRCKTKSKRSTYSKDIAYTTVDTPFPAALPQQSTIFYNNHNRSTRDKSKSSSLPSIKTQKVYDLNENTEKNMPVLLNDNDDSDSDSTTSKCETEGECDRRTDMNVANCGLKSPPKLETSIAQLTIDKTRTPRSVRKVTTPMYSTSTLTHTDVTFCQAPQQSESAWSASSTSTSGKSTTSWKSRSQRSRSSRDLAWARNVITRNSRRGIQSSSTEMDGNSFITPPSRK